LIVLIVVSIGEALPLHCIGQMVQQQPAELVFLKFLLWVRLLVRALSGKCIAISIEQITFWDCNSLDELYLYL